MAVTPKHELRQIGPKEAEELLAHSAPNRKISDNIVKTYAEAMREKRWNFDGDPIRISPTGELLDGQHRLTAITQAGSTLQFSVWSNINPAAQDTMDIGRRRSLSDALQIRGEKYSTGLAALTGLAYRWDKGVRGPQLIAGKISIQTPLLLEYLAQHPELRDSLAPAENVRRALGIQLSIASLADSLFRRIDVNDAEGFNEALVKGVGLAEGSPVLALRAAINLNAKPTTHRVHPTVTLALLIKAWNNWRDGVPTKVLTYKPGGTHPEAFPEPH